MEKAIYLVRKKIQKTEDELKEYEEYYELNRTLIDFVKEFNPFYLMEEKSRIKREIVKLYSSLSFWYEHLDKLEKREIQVENPKFN